MLVEEKWKPAILSRGWNDKYWEDREKFRHGISWHIPTQELVDRICEISPCVSIGAGLGYTESLAIKQGADIIATDIEPNNQNSWCNGDFHCEVEKIEAIDAVEKYSDRNVFMAWPPYDTSMAYDVASRMLPGKYLLYVGESGGGCNGNDDFFRCLHEDFTEIDEIAIPKWSGIYDNVVVYQKKF
jgi:hypothetical protein